MIYVDPLTEYARDQIKPEARKFGTRWCHMIADTPAELHAMASDIGLRVEWHQTSGNRAALNHYDLTPSKRALALRRGVKEITHEQFRHMLASRVGAEIKAEIAAAPVGWERQQ